MRCAPRLQGPVYGPAREHIPAALRRRCDDGDTVEVLGLRFEVIDVPGHTAGHIAYFARAARRRPDPVLRRHAVLRRLRPPVRGHAGADASPRCRAWPRCPATRGSAARTSTRCPTCASPRAVEPDNADAARATPRAARRCAPAAGRRCRRRIARRARRSTRSCAATSPAVVRSRARARRRQRDGSRWRLRRAAPNGRTTSDEPCSDAPAALAACARLSLRRAGRLRRPPPADGDPTAAGGRRRWRAGGAACRARAPAGRRPQRRPSRAEPTAGRRRRPAGRPAAPRASGSTSTTAPRSSTCGSACARGFAMPDLDSDAGARAASSGTPAGPTTCSA